MVCSGAPETLGANGVADDGAVNPEAVTGAEIRDGAADLGQVGIDGFVPLTLVGQGPATNIQNEIDGLGMDDAEMEEEAGDRVVGGDALGARRPGRIGQDGGETFGSGVTCCRAIGGDPSSALDPRRTVSDSVPLALARQEPATIIQNEIGPGSTEASLRLHPPWTAECRVGATNRT